MQSLFERSTDGKRPYANQLVDKDKLQVPVVPSISTGSAMQDK